MWDKYQSLRGDDETETSEDSSGEKSQQDLRSKIEDVKKKSPPAGRKQPAETKEFLAWLREHMDKHGRTTYPNDWHLRQGAITTKLLKSYTPKALKEGVERFEDETNKPLDHMAQLERAIGKWEMDDGKKKG